MDIYLNRNNVNNQYFLAMAQAAAFDLMKTARIVSSRHIKDLFLKAKFEDEIRRFSNGNLDAVRNASSPSECQIAISNIREECANIEKQGTMLSLEKAKVFITVNMEKREKEIGYTINAIGVIVGGAQIVSGFGVIASTATYIGKFIGANIVLNGVSSSMESFLHLIGRDNSVGFMKSGYMHTAEFLGFDKKSGLLAYHSVDLVSSFYGIVKLTLKPDAWRLFKYIPSDYYRKINTMSRASLMLKMVGAGNKIRIMSDIHKDDSL
ncbi:hypothetical protein B4923_02685 [Brenneria roseae subsp. americana]|uniref:DUF4225 domain-containing protein n=1 Tax=Brenneria roseae subsp. americana TaxID=1508507 RepID=A0A2U1TZZ9_9GAMM|nr:DUF4225 domain-containing protein [Brenneria roseae]PWC14964.1 hypothetical protein B4923_02685 [Brenneria roseae subsp. americana]